MQQQEFLIYRMYKNVIPEHFFLAFTFQFDPDADATHHSHHKNRFCLFEEQLWSFVDTEHAWLKLLHSQTSDSSHALDTRSEDTAQ